MSVTVRIVLQPVWARSIAAVADKTASVYSNTAAALASIPSRIDASLTPAAIIALALGLWRLTTDLGITGWFPISSGFFSHWQAWIALAIALKFVAATFVSRFGLSHKTREQQ
jgi:hypothetical protein